MSDIHRAQYSEGPMLCLMVAVIALKFLIILNKDPHIFILHWESPCDIAGPIQDTLQFYKHCVFHLSDMPHTPRYSPII